jgi:Tfp pilus assembly protein PilV
MANQQNMPTSKKSKTTADGFTLVEVTIALLIMMVGALAMSSLFVYSVHNNVGGSERALAMAVAQQQLEQIRSVSFDNSTLNVGTTTFDDIRSGERDFTVVRTVADETNSDGTSKQLKRITIKVTPKAGGASWIRTPVVLVSIRSSLGIGNYMAQ